MSAKSYKSLLTYWPDSQSSHCLWRKLPYCIVKSNSVLKVSQDRVMETNFTFPLEIIFYKKAKQNI